jgi:hypothetical protein
MAVGVTNQLWGVSDIVALLEAARVQKRGVDDGSQVILGVVQPTRTISKKR